jgi:hypothetical protein
MSRKEKKEGIKDRGKIREVRGGGGGSGKRESKGI